MAMPGLSGGLKDAFSNYEAGSAETEPQQDNEQDSKKIGGGGGGHKGTIGHIHAHSNGKHHVTVHDKNGQLVHHSEHPSWQEASRELGTHGAGGGGDAKESSMPAGPGLE